MPPTDDVIPEPAEVTAIVLAGGTGERIGGLPKAFLDHGGRSLLDHAVTLLAPFAASLVVCLPGDLLDRAPAGTIAVAGGASRQASLLAGLARAQTRFVVIHEVARPFATSGLVRAVLAAMTAGADAAVPVTPMTVRDSVVGLQEGRIVAVTPRENLGYSQTPQAYRRERLDAALQAARAQGRDEASAFAPLLRAGARIEAVAAPPGNIKITYPEDLALLDRGGAS